jgi:hypothetical protein
MTVTRQMLRLKNKAELDQTPPPSLKPTMHGLAPRTNNRCRKNGKYQSRLAFHRCAFPDAGAARPKDDG